MTRQIFHEPKKTPPSSYERKMARPRPPFLNKETLDTVVRDHQAYLTELANCTPIVKG